MSYSVTDLDLIRKYVTHKCADEISNLTEDLYALILVEERIRTIIGAQIPMYEIASYIREIYIPELERNRDSVSLDSWKETIQNKINLLKDQIKIYED